MLVQFAVQNFMSFREEAVLSMLAAKRRSKDKDLDEKSTFQTDFGIKLLKTAVIYGANASGKSNIFKAMRFMKTLAINSSKESQKDEEIDVSPFLLNTLSATQPSKFSIIFIYNNNMYEYAFSASKDRIFTESLKIKSKTDERERILFTRAGSKIKVYKEFQEGTGLEKRTRDNALFLSVCANFDGSISAGVISWFRTVKIITGNSDVGIMPFTIGKLRNAESNEKALNMLEAFDIGITKIKVAESNEDAVPEALRSLQAAFKKLPGNISFNLEAGKVLTEHKVFDEHGDVAGSIDFNIETNESEGTKKLIALSGPLIDSLENSLILFLDELDSRLHPLLSLQILKLFNCNQKNNKNAQLIAATHSTNMLDKDILRRDQIWLTSKNAPGESTLRSLVEYKVRNDASFEKDYLSGKYGAIPFVGEVENIFE